MRMVAVVAVLFLFPATFVYAGCAQVPETGTAGSPVQFSWGCPLAVNWSFGDGGVTTGRSVTHSYSAAGVYTWTVQSTAVQETGKITIVELPGGQCSFCPVNVPTAGDTSKATPFPFCQGLAAGTWSFGDDTSGDYRSAIDFGFGPVLNHHYSNPGVYVWNLHMTSKTGETCERSGRITIIGCAVESMTLDTRTLVGNGSVKLQWRTNNSADCHPGGDVKTVSFEIDLDSNAYDAVPYTEFSGIISLSAGFFGAGYRVIGVKPVVCRSCSPCGGACGPTSPGYDRARNEQAITVLSSLTCASVTITLQPVSQTQGASVTLSVASSAADARYDWYQMNGPHDELSGSFFSGPTAHPFGGGFYWVTATSPCGSWERSNLVAICPLPRITAQPQSHTIAAGQSLVLVASVYGTEEKFQWYSGTPENRLPISGESTAYSAYSGGAAFATSSLKTPSVTASQSFFVEARDMCGNLVVSQTATVSVSQARHRAARH